MIKEVILALVQAFTEFLPISSSGHLAIVSNFFGEPNLFFITSLHIASLFAVLIYTRKEIFGMLALKKEYRRLIIYLISATIPASIIGLIFKDFIESLFSSFLFLGISFLFTGAILLLTKIKIRPSKLGIKNSFVIGLFQAIALIPGVSRSGMTTSSALFFGIDREKAVKFSFLLFIPISIGAFILEFGEGYYFNFDLLAGFIVCFLLSMVSLNLFSRIVKAGYLWVFSFYCFLIGVFCLVVGLVI